MRKRSLKSGLVNQSVNPSQSGFTLLEVFLVMAILGVLMAIAAPSWLTFWHVRDLSAGQDRLFQQLRMAQSRAKQSRLSWQTSFRTHQGRVEVAIHPATMPPELTTWEPLQSAVQLDTAETTLAQANGIYQVRFGHTGSINGQLGRITLTVAQNPKLKRCVMISTLLGAFRKGKDQAAADQTGRFCY